MTYRILVFIIPLFFACNNTREKNERELLDEMKGIKDTPVVADSVLNSILQQIPSPLEMSALIKESGAKYNKNILNNPESYSKFNNSFERALNLGIYGADLGYSNLYEENQQCILYVGAIKELSDELRIDQFFNFRLIEKLADQRNLDSLLLISTQSFNQVNDYFQEQERPSLSILLLVGGWIEALHISSQTVMEASNNKPLIDKIGEQKFVLASILKLLGYFKDNGANFSKLNTDLQALNKIYEAVTIDKTYEKPTYEEVNGVLVTKDNSTSTVNIDHNTFMLIREKVEQIRSEIVS